MTVKPMIFSAEMVRALIDGRKTQARRIMKLPTKGMYEKRLMGGWEPTNIGGDGVLCSDGSPAPKTVGIWHRTRGTVVAAPVQVGDMLWVREAGWRYFNPDTGDEWSNGSHPVKSGEVRDAENVRWTSPIYMPRWASRLALEITDVRVQRVQDISEEDAEAEGVWRGQGGWWHSTIHQIKGTYQCWPDARAAFSKLWDSIHGPGAWDRNDWVCALTLDVHHENVDRLLFLRGEKR